MWTTALIYYTTVLQPLTCTLILLSGWVPIDSAQMKIHPLIVNSLILHVLLKQCMKSHWEGPSASDRMASEGFPAAGEW